MFNFIIKVKLATNTFKNYYIREERYINPILNILSRYYPTEDILITDKFNNIISVK